jgi:hypothetical protein
VLRPSGTLLVLAALGTALVVSAAAAAERPSGRFDVRIHGSITKRWTYVEHNPGTECELRRTYTGREVLTFRSRRPTRVLIRSSADGRLVLGALLRRIAGTGVLTGARTDRSTNPGCSAPVARTIRCAPQRRTTDGTIKLTAPRRKVVRLGGLRAPRVASACLPRPVAGLPMRLEAASIRAGAADVLNERARSVEFQSGATETTTFSGGDSGRAIVDVTLTLAFEPVAG